MEYMIERMIYQNAWMVFGLLSLPAIVLFFKSLNFYDKRKWMKQQLLSASEESEKVLWSDKIEELENGKFSFPLFQNFKFTLIIYGVIAIVAAVMTLLGKWVEPSTLMDLAVYLPIVFGVGIYFVGKSVFSGQRIWSEVADGALILGAAITIPAVLVQNEIDFIRFDILGLILTALATAVFYFFRSFSSAVMALLFSGVTFGITFGVTTFGAAMDYNEFIGYIGIVNIAIPAFIAIEWRKDMMNRDASDVLDVLFGIALFFNIMAGAVAFGIMSGLSVLTVCIAISLLYLYSKATYKEDATMIFRPIELIASAIVIAAGVNMVFGYTTEEITNGYYLFEGFGMAKILGYLFAGALGFGLYYVFANWVDEDKVEIDYLIFLLPIFSIILLWFGDWGSSYIYLVYMIIVGFSYLTKGLDTKNEFLVVIGSSVLSTALVYKFSQWVMWFGNAYVMAFALLALGGALIYFGQYLKGQWNVSDADASDS